MATFCINKGMTPVQAATTYHVSLDKLRTVPGLCNLDPTEPVKASLRFEISEEILLGASLDRDATRSLIEAAADAPPAAARAGAAGGARDGQLEAIQHIDGLFDQAASGSVLHRMSDGVVRFLQGADPSHNRLIKSPAFKTLAGSGVVSMLGVLIPGAVGQSITAVGFAAMLAVPGAAIAALVLPLGVSAWVYLRKEKATEEVSKEELQPMLDAFVGADDKERAIIGAQAALWLKRLQQRGTLNPDAELALEELVQQWKGLEQGIRDQGLAWATISGFVTRRDELSFEDVASLVERLDALAPDDQAAARQLVLGSFYNGSKPKVPMTREAASFLFDAISRASSPEERLQGALLELAFFRSDTSHGGADLSEIEVDTLEARIQSFPSDDERKIARGAIRKVLFSKSGRVKRGVEFSSEDAAKKMWEMLEGDAA